ncbi:MAG: hypothetical protein AB4352_21760 [Hormoscilla sp.]
MENKGRGRSPLPLPVFNSLNTTPKPDRPTAIASPKCDRCCILLVKPDNTLDKPFHRNHRHWRSQMARKIETLATGQRFCPGILPRSPGGSASAISIGNSTN